MRRRISTILFWSFVIALLVVWLARRAPKPPKVTSSKADVSWHGAPLDMARPSGETDATTPPISLNLLNKDRSMIVLRAPWGSEPGALGRRRADESNPEMPMALAVRRGTLFILDQVNRRIERFSNGHGSGVMALTSDIAQDLALGPSGQTALLERMGGANKVAFYGADGQLASEISLENSGIPAGSATGVFADAQGVYVEREHGVVVRLADANGNPQTPTTFSGRPTRDGKLVVSAAVLDPRAALVELRAFDRQNGQPRWTRQLTLDRPIMHLLMLDSDGAGQIYLGASVGREESSPSYHVDDQATVVVRLDEQGADHGVLYLPALDSPEESLRPLAVDDAGAIYLMTSSESGVTVTRYLFP